MILRKKDYEVIKINEKEYPIAFNLNVQSQMQDEFGTLANWAENLDGGDIKALISTFRLMVNEGIAIVNEDEDKKERTINQRTAGRLLSELGSDFFKAKMGEMLKSDEEPQDTPTDEPRES